MAITKRKVQSCLRRAGFESAIRARSGTGGLDRYGYEVSESWDGKSLRVQYLLASRDADPATVQAEIDRYAAALAARGVYFHYRETRYSDKTLPHLEIPVDQ